MPLDSAVRGLAVVDENRPAKRRKLVDSGVENPKHDLSTELIGELYLLLGGQRTSDLDGLEQVTMWVT